MQNSLKICNVVLAAGESKRMGDCKQLMKLHGRTLIRIVLENALQSKGNAVVAVVGASAEEVSKEIPSTVTIITNPHFADGQSTSVKAAVRKISDFDGAIFLLADQPFIGSDIIDSLINRYVETRKPIVHPTAEGYRVNPVLLDKSIFGELEALKGDTGARELIIRRPDLVATIDVPHAIRFADIDTQEDLKRAESLFKSRERAQ